MTNTVLLMDVVNDSGLSKTFIAHKMGISRTRLYKILSGSECSVTEMLNLSQILGLSNKDRAKIFLLQKVK